MVIILDFAKYNFWAGRCLESVKLKFQVKIAENRTNGLEVIQVLANFKMAASAHIRFPISWFWSHKFVVGGEYGKIQNTNQSNHSEVIQLSINFKMAASPSWIPLFRNFRLIVVFIMTICMLERNLVLVAWMVQFCHLVNFSFSLYLKMGFYYARTLHNCT